MREHRITFRLSDDELAIVDEHRGTRSRTSYLRALIRAGRVVDDSAPATHAESLQLLTALARDRHAQATIALERALRAEGGRSVGDQFRERSDAEELEDILREG